MLQRLRNRAQSQEGFTLIELLVVILIIGILAAVAIPTFLSQTSKANDSNVQASINSAQNAEATYNTSNNGYVNASGTSGNPLITIEPTLTTPFTASPAGYSMAVTNASSTGYTVTAFSSKTGSAGVTYGLAYNASTGAITKTCWTGSATASTAATLSAAANLGGCNASSAW